MMMMMMMMMVVVDSIHFLLIYVPAKLPITK
jgi:hypothetical protein